MEKADSAHHIDIGKNAALTCVCAVPFAWNAIWMRAHRFIKRGSCFLAVVALMSTASEADTILLKKGDELKGLIVEEHADRVILSTAEGEIAVLRKEIEKIDFDDPSYTLLSIGRQLEREKKYGEALSYYEKAAQLNPDLADAKLAAVGVRSKMWAGFTKGASSEIEKQQIIEDAWRADTSLEEEAKRGDEEEESVLWRRMGLRVREDGDFVRVEEVRIGGYAHQAGLRTSDAFYAVDARSLRYIQKRAVIEDLLEPRYASMSLEIRRTIKFPAKMGKTDTRGLGMEIKQNYNGSMIWGVRAGKPASNHWIKNGDLLVSIDGENTRYMPLNKIKQKLKNQQGKAFSIETARTLQMARQ